MYFHYFDEIVMCHAMALANFAECCDEVCVGSVLVLNGYIIGSGWNSSVTLCDPSAHAEIIALRQGGRIISNYRLLGTTLYVTLEPCIMCIGAMIHARISRLVFGARARRRGGLVFLEQYFNNYNVNHRIKVTSGVLEEPCSNQITSFFCRKRVKKY